VVDDVVCMAGYENGHQDATASEPKSVEVTIGKLSNVIQAGQFLLQFAAWQQKLQKRLRLATTVDSTLAALQLWSSFHFYDVARAPIVLYVIKRLKRLVKQSSQQYTDAQLLKQWSTGLHTAVQEATHKLKQVRLN
jgi:type VI protein secretion system component VasK